MNANINDCLSLLSKITKISKNYEQEWINSGNYFNIFYALGIERKEIRHSALLYSLLNPRGFHGIKDLFLKEFLSHINFDKIESKNVLVKKEEYVGKNGRFDISITSSNKKYKIVIENKIDSETHDNQLNKYFKELKEKEYYEYKIVYLTLYGKQPNETILNEDKSHLICLSYNNDIIEILNKVKVYENIPNPVAEIINQYISAIRKLTNQGIDKTMNEEIQLKLASSNDNMKAAFLIKNEINNAFFRHYIPEKILSTIKVKNFIFSKNVSEKMDKAEGDFGEFSNGKIHIKIGFGDDNYNELSFWGKTAELSTVQLNQLIGAKKILGKMNNVLDKNNDIWIIYIDEYVNMKNKEESVIDNPDSFKIAIEECLKKIISIIQGT